MPGKRTTNYQLCQWEPEDKVVHTDFNEDNVKIDKAIKAVDVRVDGKADASVVAGMQSTLSTLQTTVSQKQNASSAVKFASGVYTGDGAGTRKISLPFTPKAVLVFAKQGYTHTYGSNYYAGGLATTNQPVVGPNSNNTVWIMDGGFGVRYLQTSNTSTIITNAEGWIFNYIAFA